MKVLFYGDIHHGSSFRYGKEYGGLNSRLENSIKLEERIIQLAKEYEVDVIIFLGDLVEASSKSHINDYVRKRIKENSKGLLNIKRFFVVGNHDLYFKSSDIYGNILNLIEDEYEIIERIKIIEILGVKIGFVGWLAQYDEIMGKMRKETVDLWCMHTAIAGALFREGLVSEVGLNLDFLRSIGSLIIVGHHHVPHNFGPLVIAGSVWPTNLNDCDNKERGVYLWDSENPKELDFIQIDGVSMLKLVECSVNDFDEFHKTLTKVKGDCVIMRVTARKEILNKLIEEKLNLIEEYGLENLTIQPIVIDEGEKMVTEVDAETQQDRLRKFVQVYRPTGLDPERLLSIGAEILRCLESEK